VRVNRFLSAVVLFSMIGCGSETPEGPDGTGTVVSEDLVVGTGPTAANGNIATVHYVGRLTNGTVFDDSNARNQPLVFRIGGGQYLAAFEQGIVGMRVGGKRRLTIPPGLAYGAAGSPPAIPPNATLVFEVDLVALQ
jgi:peptidylprolyl isomerase/FKBP-type peptidyl-prolyl cis-trans isomerase FkpA